MNEIDRREFLRRMMILGFSASAAATLLARCGASPSPTNAPAVAPTAPPQGAPTAAPTLATPATAQPPSPTPAAGGDAYLAVARGGDPATGEWREFQAPLPYDLENVLKTLRAETSVR